VFRQAEEERECTFKPKIQTKSRCKSHLRAAGYLGGSVEKPDPWAELNGHGGNVSTAALLAAQIKATEEKRQKMREEKEMEGCTFHPHINKKAANRGRMEGPVFARLLEAVCAYTRLHCITARRL
jgi:hypothetical protein